MFYASSTRLAVAATLLLAAACAADLPTDPSAESSRQSNLTTPTGGTSVSGVVRVRCEVGSNRSKISVDGNNLRPLGGRFSARVRSGANSASAPLATAIGDEAEFDFDSDPGDIAAGAVAIAPNFIQTGAGADVVGEIVDQAGVVVATGSADCRAR
ncbi:MAG: hypothetical protein ACKVZ0_12740 [Gemmatimonadales bacterium]